MLNAPRKLTACFQAMPSLRCQSTAAMGNIHPDAASVELFSTNMFFYKNGNICSILYSLYLFNKRGEIKFQFESKTFSFDLSVTFLKCLCFMVTVK